MPDLTRKTPARQDPSESKRLLLHSFSLGGVFVSTQRCSPGRGTPAPQPAQEAGKGSADTQRRGASRISENSRKESPAEDSLRLNGMPFGTETAISVVRSLS